MRRIASRPSSAGHVDVHQHHVRRQLQRPRDGVRAVRRPRRPATRPASRRSSDARPGAPARGRPPARTRIRSVSSIGFAIGAFGTNSANSACPSPGWRRSRRLPPISAARWRMPPEPEPAVQVVRLGAQLEPAPVVLDQQPHRALAVRQHHPHAPGAGRACGRSRAPPGRSGTAAASTSGVSGRGSPWTVHSLCSTAAALLQRADLGRQRLGQRLPLERSGPQPPDRVARLLDGPVGQIAGVPDQPDHPRGSSQARCWIASSSIETAIRL